MPRPRSPAYPAIALPEAVHKVANVLESLGRGPLTRDEVVKGLGFSSPNGPSLAALSAVRKFGLVAKTGEKYELTERALRILEPANPKERAEALEKAIQRPPVFHTLFTVYGANANDDDLRKYLSRAGYSAAATSNVISSFRTSIEFLSQPSHLSSRGSVGDSIHSEPYRISITGDRIEVVATLTDVRNVDRLIAALESAKGFFAPRDISMARDARKKK